MAHTIQNKKKLLAGLSRIRGQINGIEKALNEERDCGEVLLTLGRLSRRHECVDG